MSRSIPNQTFQMEENYAYENYEEMKPIPNDYLEIRPPELPPPRKREEASKCIKITLAVTIVLLVLLFLALAAACAVFAYEHIKLKSETGTLSPQQQQNLEMLLERFDNFEGQMNSTFDSLYQQVNGQQDQIQQIMDALTSPGQNRIFPANSCADLSPSSPSGYYWVKAFNGTAVRVYCDMTRSCGDITGGWVRVAYLDMTNNSQHCPSGLRQRTDANKRTCTRNLDPRGCSSVHYASSNIRYSRVCGRIIGYQYGGTDAFLNFRNHPNQDVYVDGVILTRGSSREHIWTFASALAGSGANPASTCRCMSSSSPTPPGFVGTNYFCDSGTATFDPVTRFHSNNPLWDGVGCVSPNNCCSFNTPPWFYRQLPQATTDNIEMRVCRDEAAEDEDISIVIIEVYVQ